MTLKPDEEFVKNCLVKTLSATKAYEGEDPPDVYLEFNDDRIVAVEITRLSPISFDEDGTMRNRNTEDHFALNLCNDLDSRLGRNIPAEIDILLTIYVPVEDGRKYKNKLTKYVKDFIANNIKIGDKKEILVSNSKVKIAAIPNRNYSEKKIVGIVINQKSSADIFRNAQAILADRIKDKVEKCKKVKQEKVIWLALFNDYWLADHEIYKMALNSIKINHYFERIYIVMQNGAIYQIY